MSFGKAVSRKDHVQKDGLLVLRDASAAELDELFAEVTAEAARESIDSGLVVIGTDAEGHLVKSDGAEDRPDPANIADSRELAG